MNKKQTHKCSITIEKDKNGQWRHNVGGKRIPISYCPFCGEELKDFPKIITVYVHSSKEAMYEDGIEAGLSEEAAEEFKYCGYEVALEVELYEDGKYKILNIGEAK